VSYETGFEGLTQDDVVIPKVALIQAGTNTDGIEDAVPGGFMDIDAKTYLGKELHVAILRVTRERVLWWNKEKDGGKTGLRCASKDTIRPDSRIDSPPASLCATCGFKGRDLVYDVLFLDLKQTEEFGAPVVFEMRVKGMSCPPFRTITSELQKKAKRIFERSFKMTSNRNSSAKGNWIELKFGELQEIPAALLTEVESAFDLYVRGGAASGQAAETEDDEF
jgi:hypothetical protein